MNGEQERYTLEIGEHLEERWRIEALAGEGGMGKVYKALDTRTNKHVAVKVINWEVLYEDHKRKNRNNLRSKPFDEQAFRNRFFRELEVTRALTHKNICKVYEITESKGRGLEFMTMEYVDGPTLSRMIMGDSEIIFSTNFIVECLISGLEEAHSRGVVHSDFKSDNIMLTGSDGESRVVIMDFGFAKRGTTAASHASRQRIYGTPPFAAPEQLEGTITYKVDIYALGVVIYHLLTGKLPFSGAGYELLEAKKKSDYPPIRSIEPSLDPGWSEVVDRCLKPDPNDRYDNVREILAALAGLPEHRVRRRPARSEGQASDAEVVLWLAETYRHNGIVSSQPPSPEKLEEWLARERHTPQPWSEAVFNEDFNLPYDPRCLAVSAEGHGVAVGTKAGTIHWASWEADADGRRARWTVRSHADRLPPFEDDGEREAVRSIGFLDRETVVAGTHNGTFLLLTCNGDGLACRPIPPSRGDLDVHDTAGWFDRFTRLIPLVPPGQSVEFGFLALGLTEGLRVHFLSRTSKQDFTATLDEPKGVLTWWPLNSRLVDGAWAGGYLWLLDSELRIHRCSRGAQGLPQRPPDQGMYELEPDYPWEAKEPRRLVACDGGLALLVSHRVSFLPFLEDRGRLSLETRDQRWVSVDHATDLATLQPATLCSEEREPSVWVAVSGPEPGLRWIAWPQVLQSHPTVPRVSYPRPDGVGAKVISQVLFGPAGPPGEPGAAFLAAASRDQLHLASVVSPVEIRRLLDRHLPELLWGPGEEHPTPTQDERWFEIPDAYRSAGTSVWLLRTLIDRQFLPEGDPPPPELPGALTDDESLDISALLEPLALTDLRRLTRILIEAWRKNPENPAERSQLFKTWVLRLLQRASQVSPEGARDAPRILARRIYNFIASEKNKRNDRQTWRSLGTFAGLLRKWMIRGHTYGKRTTELLDGPIRWNRECGYDLDALVYLAKLIRRRYDLHWEVELETTEPGSPVWDLTVESRGGFSIHCSTDGSLTALSESGKPVRWRAHRDTLEDKYLRLTNRSLCLSHRRAASFRDIYRHGPHAYRLLLRKVESTTDLFLLLYCFRGWRRQEIARESDAERGVKRARFFALLLQPRKQKARGGSAVGDGFEDQQVADLEILGIETREVADELFGILPWDAEVELGRPLTCLAGTRGTWKRSGAESDDSDDGKWKQIPFVEIKTRIDRLPSPPSAARSSGNRPQYGIAIELEVPDFCPPPDEWRRSALRRDQNLEETEHNPCWSLATARTIGTSGEVKRWLIAGFSDGRIRFYLQDRTRWVEAGHEVQEVSVGPGESSSGERLPSAVSELGQGSSRSIACSAAVEHLVYFEKQNLLAYGTADGVVGVVSLKNLDSSEDLPWVHLLHTRETAPICGLLPYREDGEAGGATRTRLISLSQRGYLTIYYIDEQGSAEERKKRFPFLGLWEDRFPLRGTARAMTLTNRQAMPLQTIFTESGTTPRAIPALLVASASGKVRKYVLSVPRSSDPHRRRVAVALQTTLLSNEMRHDRRRSSPRATPHLTETTPTLARCVGRAERGAEASERYFHAWLRVLDVGEPQMIRLSFWVQLRKVGKALWDPELLRSSELDELDENFERYEDLVEEFANEAFRRGRKGRDPAKIVWEEASIVANKLAATAVSLQREAFRNLGEDAGLTRRADGLLKIYSRIVTKVDNFCNRWIGFEQELEARVLIHSFNLSFDWPDAVLIAWLGAPGQTSAIRSFLIYDQIQRRLSFSEPVVRLEALRVLNIALRRAIVNAGDILRAGEGRGFGLMPVSGEKNSKSKHELGFYDLLALVGDLAGQNKDSLSLSNPLTTEITSFYALSIILIPHCAMMIGHIISEALLLERGPDLARNITHQVETLGEQLIENPGSREKLGRSLKKFKAYCFPRLRFPLEDEKLADEKKAEWWSLMTSSGGERPRHPPEPPEEYHDAHVLYEQRLALYAAWWLSSLKERDAAERREFQLAQEWLEEETGAQHYLTHSHQYLNHLKEVREEVIGILQPAAGSSNRDTFQEAQKRCNQELENLENTALFEPQRSHYRAVIKSWRDQLRQHAEEAVEILDALNSFNRHVYRPDADSLMTDIGELALQVAPLTFGKLDHELLTAQMKRALETHPLVKSLFDNGLRLVNHTLLADTLLAVARKTVGWEKKGVDGSEYFTRDVTLADIRDEIEEAAEHWGFERELLGDAFGGEQKAFGNRAVWQTVIDQWVTNIHFHGRSDSPAGAPALLHVYLSTRHPPDASDPRAALLIAGDKPFRDCIRESRELKKRPQPEQLARLEELARETMEPRVQLSETSSGGMGMFLIKEICEFVGLTARARLLHPRHFGQPATAERLGWPLCLEISWSLIDD